MEIQDIKARLPILSVLASYGLKPDRNNRIRCPFHEDHSPSMQIYPQTGTFCCFSSNCTAGTGDVIQFIELKEKCSKHEALIKAAALAQGSQPLLTTPITKQTATADDLATEAILTKVFSYYKQGLPRTKKAVEYCKSRCLDYTKLELAYNSGGLHVESKNHHLVKSMTEVGLLKPKPNNGHNVWAKDCILFPLKGSDSRIISLYGRSISNDEDSRHFYLPNRKGLYPGYPNPSTSKLIITESIIDAASLLQQSSITESFSILSLYGTNGLTEEHLQAIQQLQRLDEILLMLNADDAGKAATAKHAQTLHQLLPETTISVVNLPDGEDVNSVLQGHDDPEILLHLITERKPFSFQLKEKITTVPEISPTPSISTTPVLPELPTDTKFITSNPELLIYDNCELRIEVLGGIKITGLDRMRVTLKVLHKNKIKQPVWHSLDLYHHGQREQAVEAITDSLDTATSSTMHTLADLTSALEHYRLQRIEALQQKPEQVKEMSAAERQAALKELQHPSLLQRTAQLLEQCGIVGEEQNSMISYLVYCTRKQAIPLHVMFLGSSGSGKTYLQERISELMPPEDRIEITQITDNALYYFKQEELKHKLILIEDLDGAMTVFYPLRELQTKRRISKTVTLKDSKGNLKTITLTVEGPVCVSGCTTKEKIYEDNANRCILLYTDMSKDQDKRINQYQTKLSAGEINHEREQQYQRLFQNMQRMLRPITIINPYAKYIQLPEAVFKPRRTMTLLLGFIEAVTFYHQYQREVKKDSSGTLYIETSASDIEQAFTLLKEVLFSKSDELTRATRDFFERLKSYMQENQLTSFKAQDMRRLFRMEPRTIQRYMKELVQYGQLKRIYGVKGRSGFEYGLTDGDGYQALQTEIQRHLAVILDQIRSANVTV
jgi:DNA primase/ABC-type dipeptide/oligopeptide/nickel transport system ATPase component